MADAKETESAQVEIITIGEKRFIQTAKGTLLPLLNLKGKDYLQVAHRIVWFRQEHPDWVIRTKIIEWSPKDRWAVGGAWIYNAEGRLMANDLKSETASGFSDYLEKAMTGAIGRALALCGYGTQFAPELDEGDRLADSPQDATKVQVPAKPRTETFEVPAQVHFEPMTEPIREGEVCQKCGGPTTVKASQSAKNPGKLYYSCPKDKFSHWVIDDQQGSGREHQEAVVSENQDTMGFTEADMPF